MDFCSIASGSSGNCIYAGSENAAVLIDVGLSGKRIEAGLNSIDRKTAEIDGILITHEHSDHIQGIGVLARKYNIPLYGTKETFAAMQNGKTNIGKVNASLFCPLLPEIPVTVGDIEVMPFSISHDAANPVAYEFRADGRKIGMATDLGMYDERIRMHLDGSSLLYLEANHDVNMLMVGTYPYYLKQRILGECGHLSNDAAAELICRLHHKGLKHVVLAHLSKENNYPELAYETVRAELLMKLGQEALPSLMVAPRDTLSDMLTTD